MKSSKGGLGILMRGGVSLVKRGSGDGQLSLGELINGQEGFTDQLNCPTSQTSSKIPSCPFVTHCTPFRKQKPFLASYIVLG